MDDHLAEEIRTLDRSTEFPEEESFDAQIPDWLSLIQFPDDTRVTMTEKGRRFVFDRYEPVKDIISRSTWSRYRSDPNMSIRLSTIKLFVSREEDLMVTSFLVTSVGTQKVQLPIRLPVKVHGSGLTKLLAHVCLSRGILQTGMFQSESEERTKSFIMAFKEVFNVDLQYSVNARGFYVKIPRPIIQAIVKLFTGIEDASVPRIIRSLKRMDHDSILTFLNTWFAHSRIYRYEEDSSRLFMFRVNDESAEVARLLQHVGIDLENGTIKADGEYVPVYIVPNTVKNRNIFKLSMDDMKGTSLLFDELASLYQELVNRDARIKKLEEIKRSLEQQLGDLLEQRQKSASYDSLYYEKEILKLEPRIEELKEILERLQEENRHLAKMLQERTGKKLETVSDDPLMETPSLNGTSTTSIRFQGDSARQLSDHAADEILEAKSESLSDILNQFADRYGELHDELSKFQRIVAENRTLRSEIDDLKRRLAMYEEQWEHQNDFGFSNSRINNSSSTLTPESRLNWAKLTPLDVLKVLMGNVDNWILLMAYLSPEPLTVNDIASALELDIHQRVELKRELTRLERMGFIVLESGSHGEQVLVNEENLNKHFVNYRGLITSSGSPESVKNALKIIFQWFRGIR